MVRLEYERKPNTKAELGGKSMKTHKEHTMNEKLFSTKEVLKMIDLSVKLAIKNYKKQLQKQKEEKA